jgi:Aspartyl protease
MKNLKQFFFKVCILFIWSSCSQMKVAKLYRVEHLQQSDYQSVIPMQRVRNHIVVKVKIDDSEYDFLLDSGAMTCLSKELAQKLQLKTLAKQKITDSMGKSKKLGYSQLPKISVGKVNFYDIAVVISDFSQIQENSCLTISGIVGANMMNKSIWQIDYRNEQISITDHQDSLPTLRGQKIIPFSVSQQGTPKFKVFDHDKIASDFVLDLGSGGGVSFPKKSFPKITTLQVIKTMSIGGGIFGQALDTSRMMFLPNMSIGTDANFEHQIVEYRSTLPYGLLGNKFLQDYLVTIDWRSQRLILSDFQLKKDSYDTFGFSPSFKNGMVKITSIYEKIDNKPNLLQIGDRILRLNTQDCSHFSKADFCNLKMPTTDFLDLTIERNQQIFSYRLKKTNIYE